MYVRRRQKVKQEGERRSIFLRYLGEVATAVSGINESDRDTLYEQLLKVAKKKTATADMKFDDRGQAIVGGRRGFRRQRADRAAAGRHASCSRPADEKTEDAGAGATQKKSPRKKRSDKDEK